VTSPETAKRYRATFLLQLLIVVASVAAFLALLAVVEGPPLFVALIVLIAWCVAVELEVLPTLVEWWVLRWASKHSSGKSIFLADPENEEKQAREERRRDVDGNPTLW
jgi:membrane protein YdbS with pleckstrin-like domain